MLALLSNGRYTAIVGGSGRGCSTWQGLALTPRSGGPADEAEGVLLYLRDRERGTVWSVGHDPVRRRPRRYAARHGVGTFALTRLDDGIEASLEVCVAPDADVELRRLRLQNRSRRARRIRLRKPRRRRARWRSRP